MSYFFQVLRRNVQERIEGNQLETRSENKMWLVRHLELIRIITMEDLRIVKSLGQPVFPPHYNILDHYIGLYHEALSTRVRQGNFVCRDRVTESFSFQLHEIIDDPHRMSVGDGEPRSGLEGQEYVTVLSWIIQTYPGKELMGDPSLGIPKSKVKPLLDEDTIVRLQEEYLDVSSAFLSRG